MSVDFAHLQTLLNTLLFLGHRLPWSTMGVGRQVPIDPKLAIFRARSWLQDCLKNHEKARCNTARHGIPHLMPRRLLHVGKSRHITKDNDRLPALSGLAHRFQTDGLGQFLAGLWSEFAISMMLWEVRKGRVSGASVAPSWSWASVQGLLTRNDPIEENSSFKAVLKDFHCDPATSDPYGAIVESSGYLRLHSPVLDGTIARSKTNSHMMIHLSSDVFAFFVNDSPIEESLVGATVKCLFVRGLDTAPSGRYVEAVVLSLSRDLEHYRRIGIAHLRKHDINRASHQSLDLSMEIVTIR